MMKLLTIAFGLGFFAFPLAAVWYPRPRWMNFCWLMFLGCMFGLVGMTVIAGDDDFNRTVSDRQSVVQRVELLEAKAFTAAFQHVLLDGQMYGVTADTEFTQGETVSLRTMQHWLFSDTRLYLCSERGCSAAQPMNED
jgi:hypothetical protein